MKGKSFLLAGAGMALVASCGFSPKSGLILDSWHEPMQIIPILSCASNVCTTNMVIIPEAWRLKIKSDEPGKNFGKNGYRDVSHRAYKSCWMGLHYPDCAQKPATQPPDPDE